MLTMCVTLSRTARTGWPGPSTTLLDAIRNFAHSRSAKPANTGLPDQESGAEPPRNCVISCLTVNRYASPGRQQHQRRHTCGAIGTVTAVIVMACAFISYGMHRGLLPVPLIMSRGDTAADPARPPVTSVRSSTRFAAECRATGRGRFVCTAPTGCCRCRCVKVRPQLSSGRPVVCGRDAYRNQR